MTEALPVLLEELLRSWSGQGLTLRAAVTPAEVDAFERTNSVKLPDDLSRFFQMVDGMWEGEVDAHEISFWPLGTIRSAISELEGLNRDLHEGYFIFADYSLWAHAYAINLARGRVSDIVIVGGEKPIPLAASFTGFLVKYLRQPEDLFGSR